VLVVTELAKKLHNFGYVGVLKIRKMKVKIGRKSENRTQALCAKLSTSGNQKSKRNLEG
jgi:hypothetical protein